MEHLSPRPHLHVAMLALALAQSAAFPSVSQSSASPLASALAFNVSSHLDRLRQVPGSERAPLLWFSAGSLLVALLIFGIGFCCYGARRRSRSRPRSRGAASALSAHSADDDLASIKQQVAQLEQKMNEIKQETLQEARRAEAEAAASAAGSLPVVAAGQGGEELAELKEQAEAAERAIEAQIKNAEATAEKMRRLAVEAQEKTNEIAEIVKDESAKGLEKLEAFVRDTVKSLEAQMESVLESEASQDDVEELRKEAEETAGQFLSMPLPLLLAGLLAPSQLKAMFSWNWVLLLMQTPLLIAFFIVMVVDRNESCGDNELWLWISVMSGVLAFSVLIRLRVVRSAGAALAETQVEEEKPQGAALFGDDNYISSLYRRVSAFSKGYFKLLLAYDGLARSPMNSLASFASFVVFIWGGVGVYYVISYAAEEEKTCDAQSLRVVSRVFAFIYVAAFLWSLIGLILWLVEIVVMSDSLAMAILEQAMAFDDEYSPSGFPILSIFVRAFLLRNDKDMEKVEAAILRNEIMELKEQEAALAMQQKKLDRELGSAEQRLEVAEATRDQMPSSAEELTEIYAEDLATLMNRIAIFSLVVQGQVEKFGPSSMDAAVQMAVTALAKAEEAGVDVQAIASQVASIGEAGTT